MAKPQLENGYTSIANELLEHLVQLHLPANQWQVLLCIIRKTYGFHKKVDYIANSQLCEATGLGKTVVSRALHNLEGMNIIKRHGKTMGIQKDWGQWHKLAVSSTSEPKEPPKMAGGKDTRAAQSHKLAAWQALVFHRDGLTCRICGRELGVTLSPAERDLNAHHIFPWAEYPELRFDVNNGLTMCDECHYCYHYADERNTYEYINQVFEFKKLAGQLTIEKLAILHTKVSNSVERLAKQLTKVSSCAVAQKIKDTTTKDTIQKKGYIFPPLPDWLDKDAWKGYMDTRRKLNKMPTEWGKHLLVLTLEKLRAAGQDVVEVLDQSTMRCYAGLFEVKGGSDGQHKGHSRSRSLPREEDYIDPEAHFRAKDAR